MVKVKSIYQYSLFQPMMNFYYAEGLMALGLDYSFKLVSCIFIQKNIQDCYISPLQRYCFWHSNLAENRRKYKVHGILENYYQKAMTALLA